MAEQWTREQKQVIESRNRNLLVSAAAGSGKTAVLVERIIRMITDPEHPMDIDRLLVMTFTRAAAAEMRERIQLALEQKLEEEPQNEHLQQQAVMVQFAQITTIDSFCLYILREHFDRLDVDPAFRIGDEGEMLLMRADVMKEMLEDYYEKRDPQFEKFVDTYAIGKADGGIEDYISQVYTFAQSNPWPSEWLEQCRRELESTTLAELDQSEWMQFLLMDASLQAEEWCVQLEQAVALCQEEDGPQPYLPMLTEDLNHVRLLMEAAASYEKFSTAVEQITFSRLATIRANNASVSPEKKEMVADCRKRVKKAIEKLKAEYLFESPQQVLADIEESRSGVLMLLELAEEFSLRFQQKKKDKNILDFDDLEHFALEILTAGDAGEEDSAPIRRPGPVADVISRQYDEILVDEYQDSNLVQETLLRCISRERFGQPNVFMVGDVKQSIYKFRLARPELFLEKYHSYTTDESPFQKIELHKNFRSRSVVLESINEVFYRIMTQKLGNIEYTEETALHPGAVFEPREQLEELKTELLLIDTSAGALKDLDDELSDYTGRELEAGMIANRIRELVDEKPGMTVWDKTEAGYRKARYGDIVILLRSISGWAETFTDVLATHGIPAYAESRTGYFTTTEVETILNLLAVIDNPIQDIPLAAVLRSPIGGITDRELAHISAEYKKDQEHARAKGLYHAVVSFLHENPETDLVARLCSVMQQIEEFSRMSSYLTMHELLYRIYNETGYYHYVSAMPSGETRRANLDMLVEKAAAYEATSYRGVFHFIQYIEKLKRYNTDFGEAAVSEQGSAVRIMSIHKSKGLEFPVVFVSGLGKQFNKQDTRGKILIDADLGIGTDYLDSERRLKGPTLKKNVMKRRMELEALGEELRVLYVAMTRAKEKLILTASDRNLPSRLEKWSQFSLYHGQVPYTVLSLAGSYLDWILMSMREGSRLITVEERTAAEQLGREITEQLKRKQLIEELLNPDWSRVEGTSGSSRLETSFHFTYPHEADVMLNTKISVSELKKAGMEEEEEEMAFLPTLPSFLEAEQKQPGGATRGTAYHRAMELLPFEPIHSAKEIKAYLDTFVEEEKMTEEAAALVRPADLLRFFQSELGMRMVKAQAAGTLRREKQFVFGIPAREMGDWDSDELVLIQGIIDAFFEEDGGLVLVDYKTDYAETPELLIKRYQTQLDYYERALGQMLQMKVKERVIYSYRLGEIQL